MIKAVPIDYAGPDTNGLFVRMYQTEDGLRFTEEQWKLAQMINELDGRLDRLEKRIWHGG